MYPESMSPHRIFYQEVDYKQTGGNLYRPDFILDHDIDVDCEDQTNLINSLLRSAGFQNVGFMAIAEEGTTNSHLFGFIAFSKDNEKEHILRKNIRSDVNKYYDQRFRHLGWFEWENYYCLIVDPTCSRFIGCPDLDYYKEIDSRGLQLTKNTIYYAGLVEDSYLHFDGLEVRTQ